MKTSILKFAITTFVISFWFLNNLYSQHCCPIVESYLGTISAEHSGDSLKFSLKYCKMGGNIHGTAYQCYLIAYLAKDEAQLFALDREKITNNKYSIVLQSNVIKANYNDVGIIKNNDKARDFFNNYNYEFWDTVLIETNDLAKKIIKKFKLTNTADSSDAGSWGSYKEKFKIAVFIPLLDDTTNSTAKSIAEDKHECNYERLPYLLFQALPYKFEINYGAVMGLTFKKGEYYIHINNK
jgi:hypothetical protein